ncbi:MAG: hypothetical protein WA610_03380 [Thermodesulfovibrionales bacterium]
MEIEKQACSLCAWRESCQKKFSVSGRDMRCPDYVKDMQKKSEKPQPAQEQP